MITHLVAVGDIHGQHNKLVSLLRGAKTFMSGRGLRYQADWNFLFIGDYIDRGPASMEVVEAVKRLQGKGAICLLGNHEEIAIQNQTPYEVSTLHSYGGLDAADDPTGIFYAHLRWFETLPHYHRAENHLFVHAGIKPNVPYAEQLEEVDKNVLLWIRDPFLTATTDFGIYVVHGHTVTRQASPDIRENRCNLDTGAGYGSRLSAAVFDLALQKPIHTFSV